MVKGVNKTVIVVNDTGNEMFEKIVFYITPKYSKINLKELNKAAGELSLAFGGVNKNKSKITLRKRRLRRKILLITAVSILSIALFSLIMILIFWNFIKKAKKQSCFLLFLCFGVTIVLYIFWEWIICLTILKVAQRFF